MSHNECVKDDRPAQVYNSSLTLVKLATVNGKYTKPKECSFSDISLIAILDGDNPQRER